MARADNTHPASANSRERANAGDESKMVTSELSPINFSARIDCHYGQDHSGRHRTQSMVSDDMVVDDVNVEID